MSEALPVSSQIEQGTRAPDPSVRDLDQELRALAAMCIAGERRGHTLELTGLVNEVWVRLADRPDVQKLDPPAFRAWASKAIRNILIDYARKRKASKRGGGWTRSELGDRAAPVAMDLDQLLVLDESLRRLEDRHPDSARVVEMRFFGGMTDAEIARILGVSDRTVRKYWAVGRAWLYTRLADD